MSQRSTGFEVDEQPLRDYILKAYHDARPASEKNRLAIDATRQFLSGPPGGEAALGRYWFQEDPEASIKSFLEDLDRVDKNLARSVLQPLLAAMDKMARKKKKSTLAPNLSVYVSSLSGSCAVKADLEETVASAVVSAAILGLSRLGGGPFERVLARDP